MPQASLRALEVEGMRGDHEKRRVMERKKEEQRQKKGRQNIDHPDRKHMKKENF